MTGRRRRAGRRRGRRLWTTRPRITWRAVTPVVANSDHKLSILRPDQASTTAFICRRPQPHPTHMSSSRHEGLTLRPPAVTRDSVVPGDPDDLLVTPDDPWTITRTLFVTRIRLRSLRFTAAGVWYCTVERRIARSRAVEHGRARAPLLPL